MKKSTHQPKPLSETDLSTAAAPKLTKPKTIAIIDGNSLMHRAFHAVPPSMVAPDGTPTNAAFGFMSMLIKFIEVAHPDAIICAFDRGRPAFRMKALEQYKAQRPPMDPDLKVQFPLIEKLLGAMNIPVITLEGWEGDDILGTISAQDEARGYYSLLVTGDKDAYQLASELTSIATTKKGISDVALYGPAEVVARYGVTPAQVPDFLGLKGDSSDNIPGVPGIGEKRASALLQEFDTLEGIYENLDSITGKQHDNLANNKEAAFISREVATIVRDLDIEIDLDAISFPSFDPSAVQEAFSQVRFMAHLGKVLRMLEDDVPVASQAQFDQVETFFEGQKAHEVFEAALAAPTPATSAPAAPTPATSAPAATPADATSAAITPAPTTPADASPAAPTPTTPAPALHPVRVGIAWNLSAQTSLFETGLTLAAYTPEGTAFFEGDAAHAAAAEALLSPACAVCDAKKLLELLMPPDSSQKAFLSPGEALDIAAFDVALANYVLRSSSGTQTLEKMYEAHVGALIPQADEGSKKALAYQAAACADLAKHLIGELSRSKEEAFVYTNIDYPLASVLAIMQRTGAKIDKDSLARIASFTQEKIDDLRAQIIALAGQEFNVDSPKQLAHILFEVMGLPHKKKTQRGYSTNASVLKELAKTHEIAGLVLHYREYAKIKSTYIDALPKMEAADGRIHTSFNEMVTATGRLSSSDPNLQNIPVRSEYGRHIRECFVPLLPGQLFLSCDYSQIELRLLAHLSGDEHLIQAFSSGADFHTQTASRVFGVAPDEVTPTLRSRAKAVNFGIVYGQQAFGLSQSLDISFAKAKDMIERYFEAYPSVRTYLDTVVKDAETYGYATTMFGRRRYIPELKSTSAHLRNFGKRTAMNHPMQGSAADIIKLAMRQVQIELLRGGYQSQLMLQVHDELDFSVPEEELESLQAMVCEVMQNVVSLKVPLVADAACGNNWAEAH